MSTSTSPSSRHVMLPVAWFGPVRASIRMTAFWLAIVLPFAYLPGMMLAPTTLADPLTIVLVVAVNLLALVVGYGHDPSKGP